MVRSYVCVEKWWRVIEVAQFFGVLNKNETKSWPMNNHSRYDVKSNERASHMKMLSLLKQFLKYALR